MGEMKAQFRRFFCRSALGLGECMRLEGMSVPHTFDNAAIKAAFSTVSVPDILSNVANKKLLQSYEAQPIIATQLCTTGDLTDFKENQRFRLTDIGDLQPVGADMHRRNGAVFRVVSKGTRGRSPSP